ncbi:unnamed protein product [Arabidopsis halleri]
MAHGGYAKRRVSEPNQAAGSSRRSKVLRVEKKPKTVSIKNQMRSVERFLRKVSSFSLKLGFYVRISLKVPAFLAI